MNNLRNKVQLIGNVGAKPSLEETKNGHVYTKISLATNEISFDELNNYDGFSISQYLKSYIEQKINTKKSLNKEQLKAC